MTKVSIGNRANFELSKDTPYLALMGDTPLQWCNNGRDGVSNHQPHDGLLSRLFRRKSKKTSKLRFTGLCAGNSPVTGEFPAQMTSYAEYVFIWWRHHPIPLPHGVSITSTRDKTFRGRQQLNLSWSILVKHKKKSKSGGTCNVVRVWPF